MTFVIYVASFGRRDDEACMHGCVVEKDLNEAIDSVRQSIYDAFDDTETLSRVEELIADLRENVSFALASNDSLWVRIDAKEI